MSRGFRLATVSAHRLRILLNRSVRRTAAAKRLQRWTRLCRIRRVAAAGVAGVRAAIKIQCAFRVRRARTELMWRKYYFRIVSLVQRVFRCVRGTCALVCARVCGTSAWHLGVRSRDYDAYRDCRAV
jgi:hypothetical protein